MCVSCCCVSIHYNGFEVNTAQCPFLLIMRTRGSSTFMSTHRGVRCLRGKLPLVVYHLMCICSEKAASRSFIPLR
jgi:hypothetical protein